MKHDETQIGYYFLSTLQSSLFSNKFSFTSKIFFAQSQMALQTVACRLQFHRMFLAYDVVFRANCAERQDRPQLGIEENNKNSYKPSHYTDLSKQISWEMPKKCFSPCSD